MKNVKNDTKYIIKRILIGVGITIILFNLKKCNVYALDRYSYLFPNNSGAIQVYNTEQNSVYLPNIGNKNVINNINVVDSALANDTTIHFGRDNTNNYSNIPTTLLHFIYNDEFEVFFQLSIFENSTNYTKLSSGDYSLLLVNDGSSVNGNTTDYLQTYLVPTIDIDKPLSQINDKTKITSSTNITYINIDSALSSSHCPLPNSYNTCNNVYTATSTDTLGNTIYFGNQLATSSNINKNLLDSTKIEILENKNNWFAYNGEILEPSPSDPLDSLTKVDLTNYGAVLLVPKSYETMLSDYSTTEQPAPGVFNTFLNLSFYTQYCTRQTLTNLTNTRDLIINNIGSSLGSLSASISGTCPTEPTETIMTYQYDMYSGMIPMGVLIYNNEVDDTANSNSYGTSYVWYDSNVYDIYLIKDIDNFSADISFIDYDGTEKNLKVDEIPTFEEMAQYAIDNNVELNKSRLNSLFGNIKLPFGFLNRLNNTSCQALRFPFPNSNEIIIIPCMSQTYTNVIGDLVPTIALIINALITYRCIINLILICQTMMDADDDKLEVLDL